MISSPQKNRGFTLIELLVVIAIIGILSSVVLGSLALARLKGMDANIKANLHTVQVQMEYLYDATNTYGTVSLACQLVTSPNTVTGSSVFATDTTVRGALQAALLQGSAAGNVGMWAIGTAKTSYAVAIPLRADSTHWWCVDSNGKGKLEPTSSMTGGALTVGGVASCP